MEYRHQHRRHGHEDQDQAEPTVVRIVNKGNGYPADYGANRQNGEDARREKHLRRQKEQADGNQEIGKRYFHGSLYSSHF